MEAAEEEGGEGQREAEQQHQQLKQQHAPLPLPHILAYEGYDPDETTKGEKRRTYMSTLPVSSGLP